MSLLMYNFLIIRLMTFTITVLDQFDCLQLKKIGARHIGCQFCLKGQFQRLLSKNSLIIYCMIYMVLVSLIKGHTLVKFYMSTLICNKYICVVQYINNMYSNFILCTLCVLYIVSPTLRQCLQYFFCLFYDYFNLIFIPMLFTY